MKERRPVGIHSLNPGITIRGNANTARRIRRSLVAIVVGLSCLLGFATAATGSPTTGVEHFRLVNTSFNGPGSIIARGVFNAGGTDYPGGHSTDLATFSNGAFAIHHPGGTSKGEVNSKTCVLKLNGAGTYSINHGYGVYSGLTGSGSYTFRAIGTFPRNANGTCDTSGSVQPSTLQEIILAKGPVSLR
jgi:hypothetical protein